MGEWRWLYRLRLRLKTLLQRERVEQELDEELRYHLECRAEQEMARGATAEEALRTAVRAMEGIARTKEECRDARGLHLVESLAQDVRYALRMMARSAGASTLSVLTLALGIGASLTILIVLVPVLLRPLPFPDAGRLVAVFATKPDGARDSTSFRDFEDWQTESHSFTGLAAYRPDPFGITGGGAPEPVPGLRASYEIFHVLGVSPAMGRVFDQREQAMNARVALISHRLWVRRFGAAAGVPGKTIFLDEVGYSIIGVLPKRFPFPSFRDPDVIVPITESPDRARGYLFAAGRLRAGVSIGAAQHELDAVAMRLGQTFPDTNRRRGVRVVPLQEAAAGAVRTPLLVLMGAAVFVLLIGCANVGNLVLARSIARRREFALRSALGAKAGRLLRQLLAEGAVIGMLAALAGWTLAAVGSEWLAAALSQQFALPAVRLDGSMLVTGALAALLCGVLGGLPAALMVWRSRPGDALQEGGRSLAGGRSEARWQGFLVVSETALSVVLLIGAGLLLRSFLLLEETRLGMDPRQTLTADLLLSKRYADAHRREVFLRELLESVRGLPGVRDAAVYTDPPFLGGGARETFAVEGQPDPGPRQGHAVAFNVVSGGFFRAMGIAMKRGRDFDRRDLERGAPVAIVNEAMARRYWPDTGPIGKRIRLYYDQDPQHWFSIVGVAGDVRYLGREVEPVPQVFVFYQQQPYRSLPYPQAPFVSLAVRTAADPAALMEAVKARIWAVDPNQPVSNAQTMEQALARSGAHRRIYAQFLGVFAAIALVMAIAGIYGLISYAAARRMQEMGIRLALGASAGQILALILRQTLLLTGAGVVLGIAGALALRQGIAALLYGIAATDAPTFAGTAILFAVAAFFAAYVPARRATRVDPMAVLRAE